MLQFLFVSLGKSTSDLLATNACYASEFGKASWQAAVQMIDISALVKYAKCIGLEIMFVDIHDYAGGLRYGLGWQARAYGIASQMGLLFMRYPQASPHRHRKLLPSAETLQYHNELRSWTCGEELRQVVYVYHFNVSDLPMKLQQLYAPEQRRWRQILKMGVMKHWRVAVHLYLRSQRGQFGVGVVWAALVGCCVFVVVGCFLGWCLVFGLTA